MRDKNYISFLLNVAIGIMLGLSGFLSEETTEAEKRSKSIAATFQKVYGKYKSSHTYRSYRSVKAETKITNFFKKTFQSPFESICLNRFSGKLSYNKFHSNSNNLIVNLSFLKHLRISRMRC